MSVICTSVVDYVCYRHIFLSIYFCSLPVVIQALMSLFVLASKDGWVNIMYHGLDAVGVDQQVLAYELYNKFHFQFFNGKMT